MYDRIKFIRTLTEEEESIIISKHEDDARALYMSPKTGSMYMQWHIKNLRCVLNNYKLTVDGSIHKYYKGNNYDDFTLSEIKEAINQLSDEVGINLDEANIVMLEAGFNIVMNNDINLYLDILKEYKSTQLYYINPFKGTSKIAGKRLSFAQWNIKVYNKKWDASVRMKLPVAERKIIPDNLLRIELCLYSPMIKRLKRGNKLKELKMRDTFIELSKRLLAYYNSILKIESITLPPSLKSNDAFLLMLAFEPSGMNKINDFMALKTPHIQKAHRRRMRRLISLVPEAENKLEKELSEKIASKWVQLIRG